MHITEIIYLIHLISSTYLSYKFMINATQIFRMHIRGVGVIILIDSIYFLVFFFSIFDDRLMSDQSLKMAVQGVV